MPNQFFDFRKKYAAQHPELKGKPIELSKAAGKAYRAQKKGGMRGGACEEGDTNCSAFSLLKGGRRRRSRKNRKGGMRGGGAEDGIDAPTTMKPEADASATDMPDDDTTDAAPEPDADTDMPDTDMPDADMPDADAAPEMPKMEDIVGGRRRRSRKHRKHAKKSGKKSAKKHHKKSKSKKHHKKSAKRRSKKAGRR